jgi:hypothetical protein
MLTFFLRSSQPSHDEPNAELPNEVVTQIFGMVDGQTLASASGVSTQFKDVAGSFYEFFLLELELSLIRHVSDDDELWKQKYTDEYGEPRTMDGTGDDWKAKFGFEKKLDSETEKSEQSGMHFEKTGEREARLRYNNPHTKNDVRI